MEARFALRPGGKWHMVTIVSTVAYLGLEARSVDVNEVVAEFKVARKSATQPKKSKAKVA